MSHVLVPTDGGQSIPIPGEIALVGRDPDCHAHFRHIRGLSRKHCWILNSSGQIVVRDLGSSNGVYVNGERIHEPAQLREGDQLKIGDVTFELQRQASAPIQEQRPPTKELPTPTASSPEPTKAPEPPPWWKARLRKAALKKEKTERRKHRAKDQIATASQADDAGVLNDPHADSRIDQSNASSKARYTDDSQPDTLPVGSDGDIPLKPIEEYPHGQLLREPASLDPTDSIAKPPSSQKPAQRKRPRFRRSPESDAHLATLAELVNAADSSAELRLACTNCGCTFDDHVDTGEIIAMGSTMAICPRCNAILDVATAASQRNAFPDDPDASTEEKRDLSSRGQTRAWRGVLESLDMIARTGFAFILFASAMLAALATQTCRDLAAMLTATTDQDLIPMIVDGSTPAPEAIGLFLAICLAAVATWFVCLQVANEFVPAFLLGLAGGFVSAFIVDWLKIEQSEFLFRSGLFVVLGCLFCEAYGWWQCRNVPEHTNLQRRAIIAAVFFLLTALVWSVATFREFGDLILVLDSEASSGLRWGFAAALILLAISQSQSTKLLHGVPPHFQGAGLQENIASFRRFHVDFIIIEVLSLAPIVLDVFPALVTAFLAILLGMLLLIDLAWFFQTVRLTWYVIR